MNVHLQPKNLATACCPVIYLSLSLLFIAPLQDSIIGSILKFDDDGELIFIIRFHFGKGNGKDFTTMRFDHLTILTTDVKESWDFYRTLPEASVSSPNNEGYFEVSFHESVIEVFNLTIFAEATKADPTKSGGAIIQFLVDDVDDYWNKLPTTHRQNGSSPRKMPWHSYSGYISDPDGNMLEFYTW